MCCGNVSSNRMISVKELDPVQLLRHYSYIHAHNTLATPHVNPIIVRKSLANYANSATCIPTEYANESCSIQLSHVSTCSDEL